MIYLLPFLSSFLLGLPFLVPGAGWLIYIALMPWFWFFHRAAEKKLPSKNVLLVGWLSGMVYLLIVGLWILQIEFSAGGAIEQPAYNIVLSIILLSGALLFSLSIWFISWAIVRFQLLRSARRALLLIPAAFVLGEFLRGVLLSIFLWSGSASIGPHWQFASLGLAGTSAHLGPFSRIGGLYFVTAAVVAINLSLTFILLRRLQAIVVLPLLILATFLATSLSAGSARPSIPVMAIQLAEKQSLSDPTIASQIKSQLRPGTKIVALPEYAFLYEENIEQKIADLFADSALGEDATIIYSSFGYRDNRALERYTSIVYSDKFGKPQHSETKSFLIPFGEYLPVLFDPLLSMVGGNQARLNLEEFRHVQKAAQPEGVYTSNTLTIGALSCSGIMSPQLYRNLSKQHAEVLVNNASLGDFNESPIYLTQARQLATFHATANAKPFIQASRSGDSYILDADGKVLAQSTSDGFEVLHASVAPASYRTPYTRYGDYTVLLAAGGFGWMLIMKRQRQ